MNIFSDFKARIAAAIADLSETGALPPDLDSSRMTVEPPRDPAHGDLATNAAMVLAKGAQRKPRDLAELLRARLAEDPAVESAEIAGPGFINLRLATAFWHQCLVGILDQGSAYGASAIGAGKSVNVEFLSANPTGPLHIGHSRGAVFGDALATLLSFTGFSVTREYYVNDAGAQVDALARSAFARYLDAVDRPTASAGPVEYPGDYLKSVGVDLARRMGESLFDMPLAEALAVVRTETVAMMMAMIRDDLEALGIRFDIFRSERDLVEAGRVDDAIALLTERGLIYEGVLDPPKGKAVEDWESRPQTLFAATRFGDDVDRPLKKSDGSFTYFASDIAYHWDKVQRGFSQLIDVWGADHGGYVKRMQAAVKAISEGRAALDIKLCQIVHLLDQGQPVKMSKRAGTFVTLRDVVDRVGKDVVRFIMLTRRNDAPLDFDLTRVTEQSKDNPVFYVQYAHARIRSVERAAAQRNWAPARSVSELAGLAHPEELALVRLLAAWPETVEKAAFSHEPHRIAFYLMDLAAAFHGLWNRGNDEPGLRFLVTEDPGLSCARLGLIAAVRQTIAAGLSLLSVTPVEEMR